MLMIGVKPLDRFQLYFFHGAHAVGNLENWKVVRRENNSAFVLLAPLASSHPFLVPRTTIQFQFHSFSLDGQVVAFCFQTKIVLQTEQLC